MNALNEEPELQEIEALLPWYAAGTRSRRDANRVEKALASDLELARQYDLVREELVETIHLNETPANHDVPAHSRGLAGSADADDRSGDGVRRGDGDAEIGRQKQAARSRAIVPQGP